MINILTLATITTLKTDSLPKTPANNDNITVLLNIVFATMGALAFFMIVLAGFRYASSQGEPDKITAARRTIAYSVIGLVIILLAAAIVNFVLGQI